MTCRYRAEAMFYRLAIVLAAGVLGVASCTTSHASPTPAQWRTQEVPTSEATQVPARSGSEDSTAYVLRAGEDGQWAVQPTVEATPLPTLPPVAGRVVAQNQAAVGADWYAMVASYPWDLETALRIINCESSGNPSAVNQTTGATGLFQIHPGGEQYKDPATNIAAAYAKWLDGGGSFYKHWTRWGGCS